MVDAMGIARLLGKQQTDKYESSIGTHRRGEWRWGCLFIHLLSGCLFIQQPGNTHGIYHDGASRAHCGSANALS
jgi:hypothetical protein